LDFLIELHCTLESGVALLQYYGTHRATVSGEGNPFDRLKPN
jgi:hypothetical protein